jgi:hypothetical protein
MEDHVPVVLECAVYVRTRKKKVRVHRLFEYNYFSHVSVRLGCGSSSGENCTLFTSEEISSSQGKLPTLNIHIIKQVAY